MSNKYVIIILIFLVIVVVAVLAYSSRSVEAGKYDDFAKCLAVKGVTMYGADWCPHCQNEKKGFGSAFQYVPYVECPQNPGRCTQEGINGYPTWIFPDGRRFEGEQGVGKLSRESGCALPQ